MAVKVVLLAVVLAGLTIRQIAVWRSDEALWAQAVKQNATDARPALNYGMALRKAGRADAAVPWLIEAAKRSIGTVQEREYRARVAEQLLAVEMTGLPVCGIPSVQPYC